MSKYIVDTDENMMSSSHLSNVVSGVSGVLVSINSRPTGTISLYTKTVDSGITNSPD